MTSGLSTLRKDHLAGGASRLAALLLHRICPIFSVVTPCHPGAALRDLILLQRGQATRAGGARTWLAALCTALLAGGFGVRAHDPSVPPVVELSVRPEPRRVAVSLHVPAAALADADLPRDADGLLGGPDLDQSLAITAGGLSRALELRVGDALLPSAAIAARASADRMSVDVDLVYSPITENGVLTATLPQFLAGGQLVRTVVHYHAREGGRRTFELSRGAERVVFEPAVGAVVKDFTARALELVLAGSGYLLFACCLVAPLRTARILGAAATAFAAGQLVSALVVSAGGTVLSPAVLGTARIAAESTIVVLAAQGLLAPRSRWIVALAVVGGATAGIDLGWHFSKSAAFAGSHGIVAWLVFAAIVTLGQAWLLALLAAAGGLLYRWGIPERWAVIGLTAVVIHFAIHRIPEHAQPLLQAGVRVDRLILLMVVAWAIAVLCAGILEAILARNDIRRAPPPFPPSENPQRA